MGVGCCVSVISLIIIVNINSQLVSLNNYKGKKELFQPGELWKKKHRYKECNEQRLYLPGVQGLFMGIIGGKIWEVVNRATENLQTGK